VFAEPSRNHPGTTPPHNKQCGFCVSMVPTL
jgi:hypothetical protein